MQTETIQPPEKVITTPKMKSNFDIDEKINAYGIFMYIMKSYITLGIREFTPEKIYADNTWLKEMGKDRFMLDTYIDFIFNLGYIKRISVDPNDNDRVIEFILRDFEK